MLASVRAVSTLAIESIVRIDADDSERAEYERLWDAGIIGVLVEGPRLVMSDLWNDAAKHATADIMMLCGDDLVWKTPGWDAMVRDAFDASPDRIVLVYGGDGHHTSGYATHPLIHRRWYEATGHFTAPYFSSDYADTWLWDVSGLIGRRKYLPFVTEHMHYLFKKGKIDQTMQENLDRRARDHPVDLYESKADERRQDAERLRQAIAAFPPAPPCEVVCAYPASLPEGRAPKLSILISRLEKRERSGSLLLDSLGAQAAYVNGEAEILTLTDRGQLSVGAKRNLLLAAARGEYTLFCDDDDRVFGDYLALIFEALRDDVDCVALTTLVTFDEGSGKWPPRLDRLEFGTRQGSRMVDCGLHLCPVRRRISQSVKFDDIGWGEDVNWALQVKPLIKTWKTITKPVYHYDFSTVGTETQQPHQVNQARVRPPQAPVRSRLSAPPTFPAPRWGTQRARNRPAPPAAPVRQRLASDDPGRKPAREG